MNKVHAIATRFGWILHWQWCYNNVVKDIAENQSSNYSNFIFTSQRNNSNDLQVSCFCFQDPSLFCSVRTLTCLFHQVSSLVPGSECLSQWCLGEIRNKWSKVSLNGNRSGCFKIYIQNYLPFSELMTSQLTSQSQESNLTCAVWNAAHDTKDFPVVPGLVVETNKLKGSRARKNVIVSILIISKESFSQMLSNTRMATLPTFF